MTGETTSGWVAVETPRRPWSSRLIEIGIWVFAPLALMLGGILLALILGAQYERVVVVLALFALAAGAYFMFRPSDRFRMRRLRAGGLIYVALFSLLVVSPSPPANTGQSAQGSQPAQSTQTRTPTPLTPEQQAAQQAEREAAAAAQRQAAEAQQEQARVAYIERLDRELEGATPERLLENTTTPDTIIVTVAVFSTLASLYRDGGTLGLSAEQEQARQRFKRRLVALQVEIFPHLRNRYGPALSRRMWENDMEVRTVGTGYRTIDLIWGGFAANRNIAEFHRGAVENFEALRFTRARYFWYRGADRWQYYTLEVPSDRDLVVMSGGRFITLTD